VQLAGLNELVDGFDDTSSYTEGFVVIERNDGSWCQVWLPGVEVLEDCVFAVFAVDDE
jgi:hypothetical protein